MDRGYIKLWRCIQNNPLWRTEPFTRGQAWIDLLLIANFKSGAIRRRGIKINVRRGEVGFSYRALCVRWNWSIGKVQRFLCELKDDTQIDFRMDTENVNVTSLIVIVNYEMYQSGDTQTDTETDTQTDTETIRRRVQNKNVKNEKNEKKKSTSTTEASKMSIFEIRLLHQNSFGTNMPGGCNTLAHEICQKHTPDSIHNAFEIAAIQGKTSMAYVNGILNGNGDKKKQVEEFDPNQEYEPGSYFYDLKQSMKG